MATFQLEAFFAAYGARPWQPGAVDCLLFLADYAMALGRPDPAAHLRGSYDSEDGFRAIIAAAGGVVPLVSDCAARIGARALQHPMRGAIGIIGSAEHIQYQFGAIHDGEQWNVKLIGRVRPMMSKPLAIWAI